MFVTIVLMNLLIAMLSQTYDEISRDARESWKLHRATILVKIDHAVTSARRASDVFWQTTPSDAGARRPLPPPITPYQHLTAGTRSKNSIRKCERVCRGESPCGKGL